MQHLLFIFTDKLMIFFSKFWYTFGIFLITYFGIYLVYNLEHFGIFYSAKPGLTVFNGLTAASACVDQQTCFCWAVFKISDGVKSQCSEPRPRLEKIFETKTFKRIYSYVNT